MAPSKSYTCACGWTTTGNAAKAARKAAACKWCAAKGEGDVQSGGGSGSGKSQSTEAKNVKPTSPDEVMEDVGEDFQDAAKLQKLRRDEKCVQDIRAAVKTNEGAWAEKNKVELEEKLQSTRHATTLVKPPKRRVEALEKAVSYKQTRVDKCKAALTAKKKAVLDAVEELKSAESDLDTVEVELASKKKDLEEVKQTAEVETAAKVAEPVAVIAELQKHHGDLLLGTVTSNLNQSGWLKLLQSPIVQNFMMMLQQQGNPNSLPAASSTATLPQANVATVALAMSVNGGAQGDTAAQVSMQTDSSKRGNADVSPTPDEGVESKKLKSDDKDKTKDSDAPEQSVSSIVDMANQVVGKPEMQIIDDDDDTPESKSVFSTGWDPSGSEHKEVNVTGSALNADALAGGLQAGANMVETIYDCVAYVKDRLIVMDIPCSQKIVYKSIQHNGVIAARLCDSLYYRAEMIYHASGQTDTPDGDQRMSGSDESREIYHLVMKMRLPPQKRDVSKPSAEGQAMGKTVGISWNHARVPYFYCSRDDTPLVNAVARQLRIVDPSFCCTSLQTNGVFATFVIGDGNPRVLPKHHWNILDGKLPHGSLPCVGTRGSVVAYTHKALYSVGF